jgi:predicted transcriptional regulator/transcriptional regulator with XRE-family HTH domain
MRKMMVGSRLRQLRRANKQTQAEMGRALGISTAYVNLLENNQRSLTVELLMKFTDTYGVDWRELTKDTTTSRLADLRNALRDPVFGDDVPDVQELRGAIDHAPRLVDHFLRIYQMHRTTLDKMMRGGRETPLTDLLAMSPEAIIHDFFRSHSNHFDALERAAEGLRTAEAVASDDVYASLKTRLKRVHGISVRIATIEEMSEGLRFWRQSQRLVLLSEALDFENRAFQLAHILCLLECDEILDELICTIPISSEAGRARLRVELANYFAAAFLMPYGAFLAAAERTRYDVDRLASAFGVSFEQACQRLTTLQRDGARGVPFFFLRIDRAGNVTKRFNSTSFNLADQGGACPVWNIHSAFETPGVILPQLVELPGGERYFTISRTADRPMPGGEARSRRLALALGCELRHASRIGYAGVFNLKKRDLFSSIGINCHLCPRKACGQRAHQPLFVELPIDPSRRGTTRYES